jgi:hypothetical protein
MLYLKPELRQGLDTPAGLPDALQTAVRLEHSTIPPYLYALYSLDPSQNAEIADLVRSVVVEEMTHMALACNILNAIGGSPVIDDPQFVPSYPHALPGAVESQLVVPLKPFSIDLVQDVFMVIEEPEHPLEFPAAAAAPQLTIGEFYAAIRAQLPAADFSHPSSPQVTHPLMPELVAVTDATSAQHAIDVIVEQGEGTTTSPLDLEGDELAHYYRFAEIFHGHQLVKNPHAGPDTPPDQQYAYDGPPITLHAAGVRPLVVNPTSASYPVGSAARNLSDSFNYAYTGVLKSLHATFNGQADQLDAAIGLMESCKEQAIALTAVDLGDGTCAGPTFEYEATNP